MSSKPRYQLANLVTTVVLGGTAEGIIQVATTRTGLAAYPLTLAEERCSMQLITVAECFTFFSSIAVILYLWIQ